MHRDVGQPSFAEALVRGGSNARLERIDGLIDWVAVGAVLSGIYGSTTGRPSYPPLVLLKVLLLQGWYGLSDPGMEEALADRLSFRRFIGLGLEDAVPDHSTISRFRTLLMQRGLADRVFAEVNRQIEAKGVVIKSGTIIDATAIAAAAAEPPRQKGGGLSAVDPDARWMKNKTTGKARFGYKLHAAIDHGTGIIRQARITPANVPDVELGHELVCGDEQAVYADKAYVGPRMRQRLSMGGIKDRVQRRAARCRPLRPIETRRNVLIGRIRGRIEGVFGTLKRSCGLARMRYMGLARNITGTLLTLTAWNLARVADQHG
jgi:transposase, IS5 family